MSRSVGVDGAGCGGPKDLPAVAPVEGTVTFKGAPLTAGEIVFQPSKGRPARGDVKDGKILNVTTNDPNDGAPVGDLLVSVFANKPDPKDSTGMAVLSEIPTQYNDASKSGLKCTVAAGKTNTVAFELKP